MERAVLLCFAAALAVMLFAPFASAATVTVSQAGADSGSIMKGRPFTIAVTGLSDSGTATITGYPSGFSLDEDYSKSFGSEATSVSWTTATINQKYTSPQKITVTIETLGSPSTVDSNTFTVKLPPSLVTTLTHSIPSSDPTGSKTIQLNVQNWGETTAQDVTASISLPSGVTLESGSSTQTKSTLDGGEGGGGENWGVSWVVSFGNMNAGSNQITITVSASNADTKTETISFTVSSSTTSTESSSDEGGGGGGGGGAPSGEEAENETSSEAGEGAAVKETVLDFVPNLDEKKELSEIINEVLGGIEEKKDKMERIAAEIKEKTKITRRLSAFNGKSILATKIVYNGERAIKNFVMYDKVPKSFARTASDILVSAPGATVKVVKEDPEYAFFYSEVKPGQELSVTYTINEEKNASILESFASEVYAEDYIEEEAITCSPGIKRCSGNALEICNDAGSAWVKIRDCPYGCDSALLECKEKPQEGQAPAEEGGAGQEGYGWIAIVLAVIIIAAIAGFAFYRKKAGEAKHPF